MRMGKCNRNNAHQSELGCTRCDGAQEEQGEECHIKNQNKPSAGKTQSLPAYHLSPSNADQELDGKPRV